MKLPALCLQKASLELREVFLFFAASLRQRADSAPGPEGQRNEAPCTDHTLNFYPAISFPAREGEESAQVIHPKGMPGQGAICVSEKCQQGRMDVLPMDRWFY